MSLEQLILKYIDGELDSHEDEKLRTLLRDDPDAKDIFESHVEINHAIKEDAQEIDVPEDLYNETEDLILMKIMAEEPEIAAPITNKISEQHVGQTASIFSINSNFFRNSAKYISYAAALFIIFLGVRNIDDSEKPFASGLIFQDQSIDDNEAQKSALNVSSTTDIATEKTTIEKNNTSKIQENNVDLVIENEGNNSSKAFGSSIQVDNIDDITDVEDVDYYTQSENKTTDEEISKPVNSTTSSLYLLDDNSTQFNEPSVVVPFNNEYASEVMALSANSPTLNFNQIQITSFAGMDYFRNGINSTDESSIAHLSQSIAYASSDKDRFGIEFGFTEYTVFNKVNVTLPDGFLVVIPGEGGLPEGDDSGNENSSGSTSSFDVGLLEVEVPVRFFWGTAFYERTLIDYKGFSFDGRLAAGASAGGPMAYIRFFAKQKIVNGVYFTLGTEGRIFRTDHPIINSNSFNSSASLIYGIQFSF